MNDHIDLINALRSCNAPADYCDSCPYHYGSIQCLDLNKNAADAIEELVGKTDTLQAQMPRWISVDERLPEQNEPVIAIAKSAYTHVVIAWVIDGQWYTYNDYHFKVSHWMPLPEPPKDETK